MDKVYLIVSDVGQGQNIKYAQILDFLVTFQKRYCPTASAHTAPAPTTPTPTAPAFAAPAPTAAALRMCQKLTTR